MRILIVALCLLTISGKLMAFPQQLRLAIDKGWAPYIYLNDEENICGTDASLLSKILADMNVMLVPIAIPGQRLKQEIASGDVDVVLGAANNANRRKHNVFSEPYRQEIITFAYLEGSYVQATDPVELLLDTGSTIAVNMAGWFGKSFEQLKHTHRKQLVHMEEHKRALRMLKVNRLHGIVGDKFALQVMIDDIEASHVKISQTIIHQQPVAFMFSKKAVDETFLQTFNDILKTQNGALVDKCSKYSLPR